MTRFSRTIGAMDDRMPGNKPDILTRAWEANQQGEHQLAYELSLQVTESSPTNVEAWIMRARTARSLEERIVCLNQINSLDPHNAYARLETYASLNLLLDKDPFLAYLDEDDHLYHVHNGIHMMLTVPKDREVPEPYPPQRPQPLERGIRWLWLAILGLLLSGIGTLIFAPLAVANALKVDDKSRPSSDRKRAIIIIVVAVFLCLLAIPLFGVFMLHIL